MTIQAQSQTVLGWLTQTISGVLPKKQIKSNAKKQPYQQALGVAYLRFAESYPAAAKVLDEHFLKQGASTVLESFQRNAGKLPTALDLLLVRERQSPMSTHEVRWQQIADLICPTERLLQWLANELQIDSANRRSPLTMSVSYSAMPTPAVTVKLDGKLNRHSYQSFLTLAQAIYETGNCMLVLDLADVQEIELSGLFALHAVVKLFRDGELTNSESGWAALRSLAAENRATEKQWQVQFQNHSSELAGLLEMNGLL